VVPGVGGSSPLGRPSFAKAVRARGRASLDHDAVLFANEAFYRAFATRDLKAMDEIWARHCPVACIHPGWGPLHGREAVMRSWAGILANPDSPAVVCQGPRAVIFGDTAMVVCFEAVPGGFLIATNLFVRQGHLWKLVHHQAGPTNAEPEAEPAGEGPQRPN
jgi:ketosteroid isomerase-like protein